MPKLASFSLDIPSSKHKPYIPGPGHFAVDVVGESHYQDNLTLVCGGKTQESQNKHFRATLVPEDENPFDSLAIRVDIGGKTVGHLRRDIAREYRSRLCEAGKPNAVATCEANVRGGWKRNADEGHFGVWLDLPVAGVRTQSQPQVTTEKKPGFLTRRTKVFIFTFPLYVWLLTGCCLLSILWSLLSKLFQ